MVFNASKNCIISLSILVKRIDISSKWWSCTLSVMPVKTIISLSILVKRSKIFFRKINLFSNLLYLSFNFSFCSCNLLITMFLRLRVSSLNSLILLVILITILSSTFTTISLLTHFCVGIVFVCHSTNIINNKAGTNSIWKITTSGD